MRMIGIRRTLILLLLAVAPAISAKPQDESLTSLASELAGAISGLTVQDLNRNPDVLVREFTETDGQRNGLLPKLTQEFSRDLEETQRGSAFSLRPRAFYVVPVRADMPPSDTLLESTEGACPGLLPKKRGIVVVNGYIDVLPDRLVLRIAAVRNTDDRNVFDKRITLPIDDGMKTLLATRLPGLPRTPANAPVLWVRPGFHVEEAVNAPRFDETKGYTGLKCVYCPRAGYTDAAMNAKIQGTMTLDVLFDAQGLPAEISIVQGLPCGLNVTAVAAMAKWKVTPALGPDGKPIAVWTTAQTEFKLF